MNRKRISLLSVVAIMAASSAIGQTKLDMGLDRLVKVQRIAQSKARSGEASATVSDPAIRVLARLIPGQDLPSQQLEAMGAVVGGRYGSFVSLRLPVSSLEELASLPQFSRIDQTKTTRTLADRTRKATHVDPVQQSASALAEGLPHEYTGKGVVVGVVDNGIDFDHVNFFDPQTGAKRIKQAIVYRNFKTDGEEIWDQDGNPISSDQVREVYTEPAQIDTLTTDSRQNDHGTLVASVAAGSYSGDYLSEDGRVIYSHLQGMAPEADLMLTGLGCDPIPTDLAHDGVYQTLLSGVESGQPFVMNLSIAEVYDWYDGKDPESLMIGELTDEGTKPGVVVCRAAGNNGQKNIYLHEPLDESNGHKMRFRVFPARLFAEIYPANANCYIYSDDDTPFEVTLEFYENKGGDSYSRVDSAAIPNDKLLEMGLLTANYYEAHDGRYAAHFELSYQEQEGIPDDLYPSLLITSAKDCKVRVVCDTYFEYQQFIYDIIGLNLEDEGTIVTANNESSIVGSACTNSVISVGAWYIGSEHTNFAGEVIEDSSTKGDIAVFSSYCVSDDNGISRPDVCAPGMYVVSGTNGYNENCRPYLEAGVLGVAAHDYREGHESIITMDAGTSFSSPVMTGIIALWLQADPTLSTCDVREILYATADQDEYTAKYPCSFGAGKANALKGLQYILANRPVAIDEVHRSGLAAPSGKYIHDGKLFIRKDGKRYDAVGHECR